MLSTRPEENHFSTDGVGLQSSEPNAQQLPPGDYDRTKRDSGYGTDFSPASVTSISRRFTFESELDETDCELDVVYEFENMDIRNEVFAEGDGKNDTSESDIFEQEISGYSTSVSSELAVRTYETSEQNESDENSEQGVESRLVAGHVSRRRVISEQNVGEHGINDADNSLVAEHDTSDIGINGYDIVPNDTSVHAIDIRVFDGHAVSGHDTDEADKEVEELLSGSGELGQSDITSQPLHPNLCRPAAPIPTPEDFQEEAENVNCDIPNCTNNEVTDLAISHSFHHMPWNRSRRKYYFRPISRSVGTQTPNPNCQIIREAIGILHEPSYQCYGFARGKLYVPKKSNCLFASTCEISILIAHAQVLLIYMCGSRKFCQRVSNFDNVFLVDEGRKDPNTTISGLSSARQRNAI